MKRKRTSIWFAVAVIGLLGVGLIARGDFASVTGLVPTAQAQLHPRTFECTDGTAKGRYGNHIRGYLLPNNPFGLPAGTPIENTYTSTADGMGKGVIEAGLVMTVGGQTIVDDQQYEYTYKVKPNCQFEVVTNLPGGLQSVAYGVSLNGGAEAIGSTIIPTLLEQGTFVSKRIDPRP